MNSTVMLPVPVAALFVAAVLLTLFGLIASLLSYWRSYSDNERAKTLAQWSGTLKEMSENLRTYQGEVRDLHDTTVTKLGVLGDKEVQLRNWHGDLKLLDESLRSMDSIVGVFSFSEHLLDTVAHEKKVTGMVVTGVVMRHPDNNLNCTIVEQSETWITEHARVVQPVEEEVTK